LGSNRGDRSKQLGDAVRSLKKLRASQVRRESRIYESAAVGPKQRPYLNCAVEIKTRLSPMGLLAELKKIEALAGRRPGPRWGPRPLDIDIADYGGREIKNLWLEIPHLRLAERPFALAPLAEINPNYRLKGGLTISQRLKQLRLDRRTVKIFNHDR
jgi:2-amino-4-hydroxy-6-hydroxymethyldihydropteridine diphosphokinase